MKRPILVIKLGEALQDYTRAELEAIAEAIISRVRVHVAWHAFLCCLT